jgi:hypothetical protein
MPNNHAELLFLALFYTKFTTFFYLPLFYHLPVFVYQLLTEPKERALLVVVVVETLAVQIQLERL